MEYISAAVLGLVQGFTEFLPVSSSGHLVIFREIFNFSAGDHSLLFDLLLHFGTLIAVAVVFWRDIVQLLREFCLSIKDIFTGKFSLKNASPYRRFMLMIVVSLIPLFAILPFKDHIESAFENLIVVGFALLCTGTLLFLSDRFGRGDKGMAETASKHALVVGAVQAVATIPGVSRSGSTISAALFCGFKREYAVKFSFIMSLPAILGAIILEVSDALAEGISGAPLGAYGLGVAVAAVSGVAAIKLINLVVKSKKFKYFGFYCLAAGLAVLIYSLVTAAA